MPDTPNIVVLPGDGIGPEIIAAARQVLDTLGDFSYDERLMGGCSIDANGVALTDEVLEACKGSDAVLLGAVGGPKWDTTNPDDPRPEQGLLGLRKGMGLYANLRPVRPSPALIAASPLREERIKGTDLLVVRELTGGIYFGKSGRDGDSAYDTCEYDASEIERIARAAFEAARRRAEGSGRKPKVTSIDKANVMETSRLWREVVTRVAPDYATSRSTTSSRQRGDAAGLAPGRLRRDRRREPLRRHPQRRGGDADRQPRDAPLGQPRRRRRPWPLRAGPRLRPRHRRQRHRQPARHLPLGGDDAAPRPRPSRRCGADRGGGRRRPRRRACALPTSPGRPSHHRRWWTCLPRSRSAPRR